MNKELPAKCQDYKKIIIYGYGRLGKLIYHFLNSNNITVDAIWDGRYEDLCNKDLKITEPFSGIREEDHSVLIIVCIGKRISAECLKRDILANTKMDCILAIDYGYDNKATKLSVLEFNLNIGCSLNCKYCPQKKLIKTYCEKYQGGVKHLSFSDFRHIVDEQLNPCAIVSFSGMSEPFENPDFIPMAEYASAKGFRIFLNTTLMGMEEESFLRLSKIEIERITLHIPDNENNSVFKITDEYLDLLDRFIGIFYSKIQRFSCHAPKEHPCITEIINKYDIKRDFSDILGDRAGNLDMLAKGIWHSGEITCTLGKIASVTHVVMPNGELALCCNDYGLEGNLGNLLSSDWEDICNQNGYRVYLDGLANCKGNYLCRKCVSAREKNWAIKNLYPNYFYEKDNYIKILLKWNDYLNDKRTIGDSFFSQLEKADHICLFGLKDDMESNMFFDNDWNSIIKADCFSDFKPWLKQIQSMQYVALENLGSDSKWVIIIFSDEERKIANELSRKGYQNYFYFRDFVRME